VRLFLLVLVLLVATAAGVGVYFYKASPTVHDAVQIVLAGIDKPNEAFPGQDGVNVLIMGHDVDRDRQGRIVDTPGRTDSNILVRVDFRKRAVNLLSIPRDTLVEIPGYHGKRRISYANAYGGPDLSCESVNCFLGVKPDHYVLIGFEAFQKAIDMAGGLKINVDKQLDYDDNWGHLHIHLKPGEQMLNGEQAIGFVRYRQSKTGDGESDFVRIKRQQEFFRAAKARLADPLVMFRAPKILDKIRADTRSDLTPAQIACLAQFIRSLPQSAIRTETLPALAGNGAYVRADMDATEKLVREMFF
jgi:LCP family protein required for cell wall assembly